MRKKKLLVVDSGGRGHALQWKLTQSPNVGRIYTAQGNAGTEFLGENVPIVPTDIERLAIFAERESIDLTIVGPERPSVGGIGDLFRARGLKIFSPSQAAAMIESSKSYSKRLMRKLGIPTPPFEVYTNFGAACAHVQKRRLPLMVKASGLADGKGVFKCHTLNVATHVLRKLIIECSLGDAGREVLIEDCEPGEEFSLHALTDGEESIMFPAAMDHKLSHDGDKGDNTGGMGTCAPVPWIGQSILDELQDLVMVPTVAELNHRGRGFRGCLFPGGAITKSGVTMYEFNARFGDPETQSYMRLLRSDLYPLLEACADGYIGNQTIEWREGYAATIVMTSSGYPNPFIDGYPITGIDEAEKVPGVVVFHAGTKFVDGRILTSGERVLGVSAVGNTLRDALDLAYEGVRRIEFKDKHFRRDIGAKALARME